MCAAIALRNIVGIAEYVFLVGVVPLQGHLDAGAVIGFSLEVKRLVYGGFVAVQIGHKSVQPALVVIGLRFVRALIAQNDFYARVQKSQFTQALG